MIENNNSNLDQQNFWKGEFGEEYRKRCNTVEYQNSSYKQRTGITEEEAFLKIFKGIDKKSRILEVGCNIGLKLSILEKMGFENLFGLEINENSFKIAKKLNPKIKFFNSSIEEFETSEKFDFIYTATVLVHINPSIMELIMSKMINLTKKYIGGLECFSENITEVKYRNNSNTLWKQNFPENFKKISSELKSTYEEKIPYYENNLVDIVYLLEKI
jgi:pseudaminic acid biosynthesis-associated methylase